MIGDEILLTVIQTTHIVLYLIQFSQSLLPKTIVIHCHIPFTIHLGNIFFSKLFPKAKCTWKVSACHTQPSHAMSWCCHSWCTSPASPFLYTKNFALTNIFASFSSLDPSTLTFSLIVAKPLPIVATRDAIVQSSLATFGPRNPQCHVKSSPCKSANAEIRHNILPYLNDFQMLEG